MGNWSGNLQQIRYAVPLNNEDKKPNETSIFRHPDAVGKDLASFTKFKTIQEIYKFRFIQNEKKIGYGRREIDPITKKLSEEITWYENGHIRKAAEKLGSGILSLNLAPEINEWGNHTLRFGGIYSKNTLEYVIFETACTMYGITSVPIYDTLGEEATLFAFTQTKMQVCAITSGHLASILKSRKEIGHFEHLKALIILDPENLPDNLKGIKEENGINLYTLAQVQEVGALNLKEWTPVKPDSVYSFSYTSGTTGEPKAAMLTHQNVIACYGHAQNLLGEIFEGDLYLSYLPLAHVFERVVYNFCLTTIMRVGIYSGDTLKLKEDLAVFRPTLFVSVPRLFNKFYDTIIQGVQAKSSFAQGLFNKGLKSKIENLEESCSYTHSFYDMLIFNKVKKALGGRVRMLLSGSAPITKDVLNFLKVVFCVPMIEGYGQTEGAAMEFVTYPNDPLGGHVGGPSIQNEFKLVDIPEMNYTSEDKDEKGYPSPRGEIWVRGPNIIPGYYKQDLKNKEAFTEDRWLMSGDVGMIFGPERRLKIIDRKKNIFKLAQGEYIAPEKLENIYKLAHPVIAAVYVYGDSLKSCIVGVVNIEKSGVLKMAKELKIEGENAEELAKNPAFKKGLIGFFDKKAKEEKLNSLERLRDVVVEVKPFGELGLLTEAFKVKRVDIREYYKKDFDEMYSKQA